MESLGEIAIQTDKVCWVEPVRNSDVYLIRSERFRIFILAQLETVSVILVHPVVQSYAA